ncbi:MAG: ABC transporter substrate-binding protein [Microthrixaceae bacterium]|nr:ABC transporter substrate-binding protein [Microthrixaceae bacterium]
MLSIFVALATLAGACGHSETASTTTKASGDKPSATVDKGSEEPGVFGDLGQVCGPGDGKVAASTERGVTDDEIQVGLLNDAGNTIVPGLGANMVKVGKAFAEWCNEAGGINGRKLVVNNRDAMLTDAAAAVIDACQHDFMLVGGGAVIDAPTIEPRLGCNLGSIPALNPSYEGQIADLQAVVGRTSEKESNWGLFRLLEPDYKDAFQKIGILTIDSPDIRVAYERFQKALESQGLKITSFQAVAVNLDNVRTYVQPLVDKTEALVLASALPEIFRAMTDVGYKPKVVVDQGSIFYNKDAVDSLKQVSIDAPIYSASTTFPLDRADENPTAARLVQIETDMFGYADQADVTPWITWLLFAKSASACDVLTVKCVIENATKDKAYTAGGLTAPVDMTDPSKVNECLAINKVNAEGITYDEKATKPTDGLFNCDPKNVIPIS